MYTQVYKTREKFSNAVVVLRVNVSKRTELVAVAIDAPVENKPQTCRWNYGVTVVVQKNTVCLEVGKTTYKTSRWLK